MITLLKKLNSFTTLNITQTTYRRKNERNEKTRHTERNRTVTDLLTNNKTCPEESIYQIGTIDESVSGEMLAKIATEFLQKWKKNSVLMYTS